MQVDGDLVVYTSHDGPASQRLVEPVRLVATSHRWYLVAFDLDRDDWRTFHLDRVGELGVTTWRYAPREQQLLALRLDAGGTIAGAGEAAVRTRAMLDQVMPPRLRSEVRHPGRRRDADGQPHVQVDGDLLLRVPGLSRHGATPVACTSHDGTASQQLVEPVRLGPPATGGTSWPSTSTATTGARSASTGWGSWR